MKGEKRGTETRLPNTEQHWKSEDYIAPSCEGHKVCLYSGETKPAGDKATIFFSFLIVKGPKHRSCVCNHSPWGLAKGRRCRLQSHEEILECEALGRDMVEWLWAFCAEIYLDFTAAILLEKKKPLQGGKQLPYSVRYCLPRASSAILLLPPCILFSPSFYMVCLGLGFVLCEVFFFHSFFSPVLHLNSY